MVKLLFPLTSIVFMLLATSLNIVRSQTEEPVNAPAPVPTATIAAVRESKMIYMKDIRGVEYNFKNETHCFHEGKGENNETATFTLALETCSCKHPDGPGTPCTTNAVCALKKVNSWKDLDPPRELHMDDPDELFKKFVCLCPPTFMNMDGKCISGAKLTSVVSLWMLLLTIITIWNSQ